MTLVFVFMLIIGCSSLVAAGDESAIALGRDSIPTLFHHLIDGLNSALANNDLSGVLEKLQDGGNRFKEMIPKISSDNVREFVSKTIVDIGELMKKLSSREGGLDDVRRFIDNAKDELKQRVTDKIKQIVN